MSNDTLAAEKRSETGRRACRRLREQGKIPAVLYGRQQEVVSLCVSQDSMDALLRSDAHVVQLGLDGQEESALIKDVQYDHLGDTVLHVDFTRVSMTEELEVSIQITSKGEAPGLEKGGILEQPLRELTIRCLASNIPSSLVVDISGLEIEDSLRLSDIPLPEGVTTDEDPGLTVFMVTQPREEEEEAEVEGGELDEAAGTEPEVIARGKEDEEAGEEK